MSARTQILDALRQLLPSFAMSDGSIEAKIVDVVGTYADSEAIERNNSVAVIQRALATQRITTRDYYRRKAVEFQFGDMTVDDPVNYLAYYENVDLEKRIIKQAYIIGEFPSFSLLVNAVDGSGNLRALTAEELAAFRSYFEAFQPLGLELNINSLPVAVVSDPGIIVYIRAGSDANDAAQQINANLLAYQSEFRQNNTVSLSEIENVIQRYEGVLAVGWSSPHATEVQLDGTTRDTVPVQGVFNIVNGAFRFGTTITVDMIRVIT